MEFQDLSLNSSTATQSLCKPDFVTIQHLCVARDYYSVDGVRTPLGYPEAKRLAQQNGYRLPTKDEVDMIYREADLKLAPIQMPPGPQMTTRNYYVRHDTLIDEQIGGRAFRLVAGHKKDLIQQQRPGGVTIYGWHRLSGTPIQPVSSVHGENYADYSHGVRFVYEVETNG